MRVLIIPTGGTILSEETSGYFALSQKRKNEILSLIPHGFEAEVFSPYFILSEQLDGGNLSSLIETVGDNLAKFDAVVILHGTDTLQFSAAALSLAFGNCDIPIVLVSANYVLDDARSNGRSNLRYAFRFIQRKIGGVYVSYKNTDETPSIYLGHTLLPHLPYSDALYSTGGALGYFEAERFIRNDVTDKVESIGKYTLGKYSPVLWIHAAAGISLPDTEGFEAVLIEAYHSGTLPTENEQFINFCKTCGKPVYVVGVHEGTRYSSAKAFDELNLKVLPPCSPVFAYILLWQKYSR